jgi:hypothetical protein
MNAPRLTDAQVSQALRAHLPDRAQAGLRERVMEAAEVTTQQRSLPSFLGALSDADPVARRRSVLIAAALLAALALAGAVAVGASRLLERDPIEELSLEPPADVPAFVLSSYERLPQLPPLALTWRDDGSSKGRIHVDRSGAVRFDRFASAEATEPSSYTILRGNRISGMALVESEAVWVEEGHDAFGDDPRVFIRTVLNSEEEPGCEMERDPDAGGDGTAASDWRYVGAEYVAGRPTHHFACVGEIWLDIETRLILRTRAPLTDDTGQPIPGQFETTEVTEITFGEQPAALFEPPQGIARMPSEAYNAYLCTRPVVHEDEVGFGVRGDCAAEEPEAPPQAEGTSPTEPSVSDCAGPPRDPSEPTGPLAWTQASLSEDWPAPVRPEPAGGPVVDPLTRAYVDPSHDTGADDVPCVDIQQVGFCEGQSACIGITLVSNEPPVVDPSEQWMAYGVVVDDDGDGVPDRRFGMDNVQVAAPGEYQGHRRWITDLHTGRTLVDDFDGTFFDTFYPPGGMGVDGARLSFGGDATGGGRVGGLPERFYAWASVIKDGRVVATDYAPDAGWLHPSPGADPGGRYVLDDPFPLRLTMTIGDGWTVVDESRFYHVGGVTRDDGQAGIRIVMVDNLVEDACAERAGSIDGRATVDDVVAFLDGLPLLDLSVNTAVTLDGHRGTYVEFARTAGQIDCGWGGMDGWPASSPTASDEVDQVWILDVDGAPLVIDAFSSPLDSDGVRAELRQIVESIQIDPSR